MKVYELIQELSQYKADTEVEFHVNARFDTDVEAEFDRDNESDTQDVTVIHTTWEFILWLIGLWFFNNLTFFKSNKWIFVVRTF